MSRTRRNVTPRAQQRLRSGLKRHGLVRRPESVRRLVKSRALRFVEGNQVDLFDNGRDGLSAMLATIEGAQQRVHLESYILRGDRTGREFLGALEARARRGVEVRVLYDAVGSRGLDPGFPSRASFRVNDVPGLL